MSGTDSEGGDPVCWLDRVCPECGAFRENPALPGCARCGTVFGAPEDAGTGAGTRAGTDPGGGSGDGPADRTPGGRSPGRPAAGPAPSPGG